MAPDVWTALWQIGLGMFVSIVGPILFVRWLERREKKSTDSK